MALGFFRWFLGPRLVVVFGTFHATHIRESSFRSLTVCHRAVRERERGLGPLSVPVGPTVSGREEFFGAGGPEE